MTRWQQRKNRRIHNPQPINPKDPPLYINNRHVIPFFPHSTSATPMILRLKTLPDTRRDRRVIIRYIGSGVCFGADFKRGEGGLR